MTDTNTLPTPGEPTNYQSDTTFALEAAGLGVWKLGPGTTQFKWDNRCGELFGLVNTTEIPYKQALRHIHPDDRQRVDEAVRVAMNPQYGGTIDVTCRTIGADGGWLHWVRLMGQSAFTEAGAVCRFAGVVQDVTQEVHNRLTLERKQEQYQYLLTHSPMVFALFRGPNFIIELANDGVLDYWNREREEVINKPLFEALPEASQQGLEELLTAVYRTGERFVDREISATLKRRGQFEQTYLNLVYEPFYEADQSSGADTITGVTVVCVEITEQVLARKRIEESEAKLRAVVENAPFLIGIYSGREMRIELANQSLVEACGKGDHIIGKRFADVLPELGEQGVFALLDEVYRTGIAFHAENQQYDVLVGDVLTSFYYNHSYMPLFDAAGQVYGVMNTGVDVTEAVLSRQKIEQSETRFRQLVEQAPAAMLVVKGEELVIETINQPMLAIMGRSEDIVGKPLEEAMPELVGQVLPAKCRGVLHTGVAYYGWADEAQVYRNGRLETGYYNVSYTPLYEDGLISGVMQVAVDVTAIRQSEERYRSLFNSMNEAYYVIDILFDADQNPIDYRIIEANPAFEKLTGLQNVMGRTVRELVPNLEIDWIEQYGAVALTGEARRFGGPVPGLDNRWCEGYAFRLGDAKSRTVAVVLGDITERKRTERILCESEEKQKYLLQLADALRPLSDPAQIQAEACRLLGEWLGVDRAYYVEVSEAEQYARVGQNYLRGNSPSLVGTYRLADYGWTVPFMQRGEAIVVTDAQNSPDVPEADRAAMTASHIRAHIIIPLVKAGVLVSALCVTEAKPRTWTEGEIECVRETGERIWAAVERAHAEAAQREMDARMQKAMSAQTVGVLFFSLVGRIQEVNETFTRMSGFTRDELQDMASWQTLTPPEFKDITAQATGELAEKGETAPYEKQLFRKDGSRWWGLFAPTRLSGSGPTSQCVEFIIDITERKRTEEALQESEAQIAADLAGVSRLYELQSKLADEHDLHTALREILAVACEFTGTDRGCVQLLSADEERLEMAVWQGYTDDSPFIDFFRHEGLEEGCEVARIQRQRLIIEDTVGFPGLEGTHAGVAVQADGIRASQATPMSGRSGETIGVIATQFRQPHRPSEHELRLVDMLAWTAGEFLERHRANSALRESEEKYRTLFNSIDEGYLLADVVFDAHNQAINIFYHDANLAATRMTGQDFKGRRLREINPDYEAYWYDIFGRVARTGTAERLEQYAEPDKKWYDFYVFKVSEEGSRIAVVFQDITERKQREAHLAFLADIADDLSRLWAAEEIMETVGAKIGQHLQVKSCLFVDVDDAQNEVHVYDAWNTADVPSLRYQTIRLSDFINEEFSRANRVGDIVVVRDTQTDPRIGGQDISALGLGAFITVPFNRAGVWTNYLAVTDSQARDWRTDEIELFGELSNRIFPRLERARAEESLRREQERTRIAIESAEMGTWEWNLLTNEVYWNEQHFRLFGMEPHTQPLTPDDFTRHVHPDDLNRIQADLERTIREKTVFDANFRALRQDGPICWMSGYGRITGEKDGQTTRLSGVMFDINDRKQSEDDLRRQEAQLRIVMESIKDHALITTDTQRRITSWNPGAQTLFGFTAEEALGQSEDIIFTPEDRAAGAPQEEAQTARREGKAPDERYHMRKDGSLLYVSGVQSPLYHSNGELQGYVKVARDLTERRQMEQALREADRRKDEFLATLAHELRNPLAPIRNSLQILEMTTDGNEMVISAVKMMSRQVNQLVRLIDDLLDVSRISRGTIPLRLERLDLNNVVRQAVEATRPLYQTSGLELTVSLPETPFYLQGDMTRLIQVVSNLLNNAAKFTNEGGRVWLTVERTSQESEQLRHTGETLLLRVRDNGVGIAADQLERIFELFAQADNTLERSQGGLGLGLTLVRELVELHGGRVIANSEGVGEGSEFTVRLPALPALPNPQPASQTGTKTSTGRRILVVDDNADAALTLAMLLKIKGNQVQTCHSGQEGIAVAESLQPEVILLDISMPGLNGYDTCRLIRQQPWGKSMVVIALTGYGQEEDKRLSQEAGFDAHLIKPVDLQALMKLLKSLLPNQEESTSGQSNS